MHIRIWPIGSILDKQTLVLTKKKNGISLVAQTHCLKNSETNKVSGCGLLMTTEELLVSVIE